MPLNVIPVYTKTKQNTNTKTDANMKTNKEKTQIPHLLENILDEDPDAVEYNGSAERVEHLLGHLIRIILDDHDDETADVCAEK